MPLHIAAFYTLLIAGMLAAWTIGGQPERQVAAMLFAATLLSKFAAGPVHGRFVEFELALFAIDVLLLAGLVFVALTSDRYWPLWLTPLHAYTVIAHLGRLARPDTFAAVYLSNSAMMADPGLVILIFASWRHCRRTGRCRVPDVTS